MRLVGRERAHTKAYGLGEHAPVLVRIGQLPKQTLQVSVMSHSRTLFFAIVKGPALVFPGGWF